ncbi:MAG: SAM-dependent chlorinase/fluorinase [Bryobacterales bacterium]|nr:SAM-dependent chlorinase/fluorinase [Bryobacterales bacterium]
MSSATSRKREATANAETARPPITLLTDFGSRDAYAAIMKGVILGIAPQAKIVDLCHEVTPYQIPEAGFILSQSYRYFPKGSIHVVVVDPGVGSERRALAVEALGHRFIGPDNGVFSMLLREAAVSSNGKRTYKVREITNRKFGLPSPGNTFHGRDIFAPAAAHLSAGVRFSELGPLIEDALRQDWDLPIRTGKRFWQGAIFKTDRFGNLITNFRAADFPLESGTFELQAGMERIQTVHPHFAAAVTGELFLFAGSSGYWEIALNQASASKLLGLSGGSPLELALLR